MAATATQGVLQTGADAVSKLERKAGMSHGNMMGRYE